MKLDYDMWYVRWFFWALGIRDAFRPYWKGKEGEIRYTNRTNFCFFFRTMTVTAPLIILLHLVVYGLAILSLTWFPVHVFGGQTYFSVLGSIIAIALIIFGVNKSLGKIRWPTKREPEPPRRATSPSTEEIEPSFFDLVREWAIAIDKKICPIVEFSKKKEVRQ